MQPVIWIDAACPDATALLYCSAGHLQQYCRLLCVASQLHQVPCAAGRHNAASRWYPRAPAAPLLCTTGYLQQRGLMVHSDHYVDTNCAFLPCRPFARASPAGGPSLAASSCALTASYPLLSQSLTLAGGLLPLTMAATCFICGLFLMTADAVLRTTAMFCVGGLLPMAG